MTRRVVPVETKRDEHAAWIEDNDNENSNQEKVWLNKNMSSPDQLLVTPSEDQKGSTIFEVPASELKNSYTFCPKNEKSISDVSERNQLFQRPSWQKLVLIFLAELIGTAFLMFFGCMGLVPQFPGTPTGPYSGAISFACIVAVTIVIIGHISDCHLNPCVTLCAVILGKISIVSSFIYVIAEFLGALIGYGLLVVVIPYNILNTSDSGICVTSPVAGLSVWQALLIEGITTGCLILVVCAVWDPRSGNGDCGPLKFLVIILLTSIVVGPFTGNSLNPARSLAPAIYNNSWEMHWIYWVGPFSGTIMSTLFYKYVFMVLQSNEQEK